MKKEQGSDNMIGCTEAVSVSTSCSRCSNFMFSSCSIIHFPCRLHIDSLYIYSIDTILYPYTLPLESIPLFISSLKIIIFGKALMSSSYKRDIVKKIHR